MEILVVILLVLGLTSAQAVCAQEYTSKNGDPNLQHFYMGRQEIEVIDNTPIVKYRGAAGDAGQQTPSSVPGGPQPLPAAGFQQYSSNVKGGPLNLPKVENGVPKPLSPAQLKANAAKLKVHSSASAQAASKKSTAVTVPRVETYKQSYQSRPPQTPAPAGAGLSSSQKVHGKLLPFATNRSHSNY